MEDLEYGYLYRYETVRYSRIVDADLDWFVTSGPELILHRYPIIRRTPCGAWIEDRFVLLTARKKWACESETEAKESFIARKHRQIGILRSQLKRAEEDLTLALTSSPQNGP